MTAYHIAQINIATMLHPLDDPRMAEFVDNLVRINAIADQSPGFVWRLQDEAGDATGFRPLEPNLLINMSVWKSIDDLRAFVYGTDHAYFLKSALKWFHRPEEARLALWWVPAGAVPTVEDGIERIARLRAEGPSEQAFSFKQQFSEPAGVA